MKIYTDTIYFALNFLFFIFLVNFYSFFSYPKEEEQKCMVVIMCEEKETITKKLRKSDILMKCNIK